MPGGCNFTLQVHAMEVILAKSAGFCYGVRRALDTVTKAAASLGKPMFTLGPLIHNPQVIEKLESEGVRSVAALDDILAGSVVVMPSHGVPGEVTERAAAAGLEVIDVTCPFVQKVHRVVQGLVRHGYQVIVLGDKGHTEVRGIMSMAGDDALAVEDVGELPDIMFKHVGVVAQTTQTAERYQRLVSHICTQSYEVRAYNTICNATIDRQKAAVDVARDADVMVVVGGRNSANTRRLEEICAATGVPTYHVEVADEIDPSWFSDAAKVGVTAGASTPDWIIREVLDRIRAIDQSARSF
jgi:(E)-4-hydroxy-3-methyl-but-2-enyl pyrophosphate reductase